MTRRIFLAAEDGTTSVEYAVMLALIIVVCIGALQFFGSTAGGSFLNTNTRIESAVGASS
jgi:pilus assembly protein Flp/PilA